jgi:carotenoid 1,2-hydratase
MGPHGGPAFDAQVPRDGYAWWYLDGLSDDGHYAITVIAFVGSVFSPRYRRARLAGRGEPMNHCALNVALYDLRGGRDNRWAMTERPKHQVARSSTQFTLGPSSLSWRGDELHIDLNETCCPLPRRLRGKIIARPKYRSWVALPLAGTRNHGWAPVAPEMDLTVELTHPGVSFRGQAYHDSNFGARALEDDFRGWNWTRLVDKHGLTRLTYAVDTLEGRHVHALDFRSSGCEVTSSALESYGLGTTRWGIEQLAELSVADELPAARVLEDTPFYSRSIVSLGEQHGVSETLSMSRFTRADTQFFLPFRMRGSGWLRR